MKVNLRKNTPRPDPSFLEKIEKHFGSKVELNLQNNTSSLLRIERRFRKVILSLHHMFYAAQEEVIENLYQLSLGGRKGKQASLCINQFIESQRNLVVKTNQNGRIQGRVYDLQAIFDSVNAEYFEGKLDLFLTWFSSRSRRGAHLTLGTYQEGEPKGLIRINDRLDQEDVPEFFIRFVMYHEALHSLFPIEIKNRRRVIHSRAFRQKEKLFKEYPQAKKWQKEVFNHCLLR